jgi:hypothetical protein
MKIKIRFAVTTILVVISFFIISLVNRDKDSSLLTISNPSSCRITGDRWIVTTAASLRPETVQQILTTSNWNLMVIGEKDTPSNRFEQFSSSKLLYLSFQEQMKIDLHSARYISYGINAQRNIGYLIAIFCGAKVVYELDGISHIWDSDIQVYPSVQSAAEIPWLAFRRMRSPFINIYGIFGQPQLWPRGLPLVELQNISEDGWSSLRRNDNEIINAYIQQKLIDFDPDVDAVAQLIHRVSARRATFDHDRQPVALEPFTFSPYNSKNTIHHLNAFWGLYLPVTIHPRVADIWRGFWVQRLLWDIGGHVIFIPSTLKKYGRVKTTIKDMKTEQILHDNAGKLVRFLSSWKYNATTLPEGVQELIAGLTKAKFLDEFEITIIQAWLHDLDCVKYKYPLIKSTIENVPSTVRIKRSAVCLTGLTECVQEVWARNEMELRKRLNGDIDVFLFLSAGSEFMSDLSPTISETRIKQARFYNTTINIVRQDILDIDPGFSPTCKYQYTYTQRHKIVPIEQERFAQANCYNIVREYERKRNIRYQLLIRARSDAAFARLPVTFERNGSFDPSNSIIVPDEHHYYGINDRFAIGPIDFMKYYMCRWYQLPLCLTEIVHPESFLSFVLRKNNIKVTRDIEISLVQIPHDKKQCH